MDDLPYFRNSTGKCPHCGHDVYFSSPHNWKPEGMSSQILTCEMRVCGSNMRDQVHVYSSSCPNKDCQNPIVVATITSQETTVTRLVHPVGASRFVSPDVPKEIKQDFMEASDVLPISEKASAALSRRCLQNLLNDQKIKGKDLCAQIEEALKILPTAISENLDAIRQIGNFAAHPIKYKATGEIADVEPEEASWNLDVLEQLFDFFLRSTKKS